MIIICKQLRLQVTTLNIHNLHTVIWFQVFLSNTNDSYTMWFQVTIPI